MSEPKHTPEPCAACEGTGFVIGGWPLGLDESGQFREELVEEPCSECEEARAAQEDEE